MRWLGITDKYWAATLLPDIRRQLQARFSAGHDSARTKTYQTDYLLDADDRRAGRDRRGR